LALSFTGAYLLGDNERWLDVHVLLGYTVLGLLAFRVVWGLVGTRHARFASFVHSPSAAIRYFRDELTGRGRRHLGHNPAGSWAVYGLLLLGVATGATGILTFYTGEAFEEVHEVCANAWLALVLLHILGVIFSSLVQRENLARAMVTGYRRGTPDSGDVRPLVGVGVTLAAAIVGFLAWNLASNVPIAGDVTARLGNAEHSGHSELAEEPESDDD
jgi:cytochrome b